MGSMKERGKLKMILDVLVFVVRRRIALFIEIGKYVERLGLRLEVGWELELEV